MVTLTFALAIVVMPAAVMPAPVLQEPESQAQPVPESMHGFRGMIVGRVLRADHETGEVDLELRVIERKWRQNRAERPEAAVGRVMRIEGISGSFLDTLVTLEEGDGLQIEVFHERGDHLQFLGETVRRVPVPEPQRPESERPDQPGRADVARVRGFDGQIHGHVVGRRENGIVRFRVDDVTRLWRANRAEDAEALVGRTIHLVPGRTGREANANHERFLRNVRPEQEWTLDVRHGEEDYFVLTELTREQRAWAEEADDTEQPAARGTAENPWPDIEGFRGIIHGRVLEKDVEAGRLVMEVVAVPRVWRQSSARRPESMRGHRVVLEDIAGRFLDVLISLEEGDGVEAGAFHRRENQFTFPGELLRKVEGEDEGEDDQS